MPNQTFFNLPQAKRQRLMDAIWQEFTTASYMDASINKIIQAADISRGSFYQYFSGKQDVFSYILQTIFETMREQFQAQLTVHGNDLFAAVVGMYDLLLWRRAKARQSPLFNRVHTLLQLNAELDMTQFSIFLDQDGLSAPMQALLDKAGFPPQSPLQCRALIHMLLAVALTSAADALRHPSHEACNRELLQAELALIRRGLMATEDRDV